MARGKTKSKFSSLIPVRVFLIYISQTKTFFEVYRLVAHVTYIVPLAILSTFSWMLMVAKNKFQKYFKALHFKKW